MCNEEEETYAYTECLVGEWLGVDVKCAPEEVTKEKRMANSMSLLKRQKESESRVQGT